MLAKVAHWFFQSGPAWSGTAHCDTPLQLVHQVVPAQAWSFLPCGGLLAHHWAWGNNQQQATAIINNHTHSLYELLIATKAKPSPLMNQITNNKETIVTENNFYSRILASFAKGWQTPILILQFWNTRVPYYQQWIISFIIWKRIILVLNSPFLVWICSPVSPFLHRTWSSHQLQQGLHLLQAAPSAFIQPSWTNKQTNKTIRLWWKG